MHTLALDTNGHIWATGIKSYAGFPSYNSYKNVEEQNIFELLPNIVHHKFLQISSGEFHNLALSTSGEVFGWGKADYGKLGQNTYISLDVDNSKLSNIMIPRKIEKFDKIAYVSCGVNHSACLNKESDVFVCGLALQGRLGVSKEDMKLLKSLKKITSELNVPILNTPYKLMNDFEEGNFYSLL